MTGIVYPVDWPFLLLFESHEQEMCLLHLKQHFDSLQSHAHRKADSVMSKHTSFNPLHS